MLCLSRRLDESIEIAVDGVHRVTVTVVGYEGSKVRLGFAADKDVKILRTELIEDEPQ